MSRTSPRPRLRRLAAVTAVTALAACVVVGGLVAGRELWTDEAVELDLALAQTPAVRLAEVPSGDGLPARGVFAQVTPNGLLCVLDAPLAAPTMGGGGCNPADDPFGGRSMSATLAFDGGPSLESVSDARVAGIASVETASIRIQMSDGSWRAVKLKKARIGSDEYQAFGYRFRKADLKRGVSPVAIVAFDADGAEIDRQTTGIG